MKTPSQHGHHCGRNMGHVAKGSFCGVQSVIATWPLLQWQHGSCLLQGEAQQDSRCRDRTAIQGSIRRLRRQWILSDYYYLAEHSAAQTKFKVTPKFFRGCLDRYPRSPSQNIGIDWGVGACLDQVRYFGTPSPSMLPPPHFTPNCWRNLGGRIGHQFFGQPPIWRGGANTGSNQTAPYSVSSFIVFASSRSRWFKSHKAVDKMISKTRQITSLSRFNFLLLTPIHIIWATSNMNQREYYY